MYDVILIFYLSIMALITIVISIIVVLHIVVSNRHSKDLRELDRIDTRSEKRKTKRSRRKRYWFLRYKE